MLYQWAFAKLYNCNSGSGLGGTSGRRAHYIIGSPLEKKYMRTKLHDRL